MTKDFSDFLKSLNEDKIAGIANNGAKLLSLLENQENSITKLGNQIGTISLGISLALLEEYHLWLSRDN